MKSESMGRDLVLPWFAFYTVCSILYSVYLVVYTARCGDDTFVVRCRWIDCV